MDLGNVAEDGSTREGCSLRELDLDTGTEVLPLHLCRLLVATTTKELTVDAFVGLMTVIHESVTTGTEVCIDQSFDSV